MKSKQTSKTAATKTLVVVESPAKAKTIEKYLGRGFMVRASMGHLRDLPKSQFGIDVDNGFAPKYINIRGRAGIINALKKDAAAAKRVYLASDPDREGEAIAWHLAFLLGLDEHEPCRIVFNEITKPAIQAAVKRPANIDLNRVDAQQARRMLDRMVGYKLSPLLWRKVRRGLSAGRVQSVAVRLICDREREVAAFTPVEYWTVGLSLKAGRASFAAELVAVDGHKPALSTASEAEAIVAELRRQKCAVREVKAKQRQRKPLPPFNTSSLQQEAARKLGFTSQKTMSLAQQLYEGISLGRKGPQGLITYMRTDSTRLSELALAEVREHIKAAYGAGFLPKTANVYAAGKKAQDAHEAIRPTAVAQAPAEVRPFLSDEQLKLYTLIYNRFVACQMTPALYDTVAVGITAGRCECRATGSRMTFPGFTAAYSDTKPEKDTVLPQMSEGQPLALTAVEPQQHFTEPPPRYNEASLVKTMEERGIGRPSTYAPIIETILGRGYVERRDKQFKPTDLGFVVTDLLAEHFDQIVDVQFTAAMESRLDDVAEGKLDKNVLLRDFYAPFADRLAKVEAELKDAEPEVIVSDVKCEKCGAMMVVKQGRYGKFLACPNFPQCRNTKPITKGTGVNCPKCGKELVERHTRGGRAFYSCSGYPGCDFITWDEPLPTPCPSCGSVMLRYRYRSGKAVDYCCNDECDSRRDHPINRELEKRRRRRERAEAKAAASAKGKATRRKAAKSITHD